MAKRSKAALAASAVLLTAALGAAGPAAMPPAAEGVTYLDQGWSEAQRRWFYHASQGTRLLPVAWFLALERPSNGGPPPNGAPPEAPQLLAAPENLVRFGFLADPGAKENPRGLPVGFAVDPERMNEGDEAEPPALGLTCAACHTGQVEHNGRKLRIDGGPALVDFDAFQSELVAALGATAQAAERFDRFARRISQASGQADTPELRDKLRRALTKWLERARDEHKVAEGLHLKAVDEGPGRLDALGRGGNLVFGTALGDRRNYAVIDAPVSYPPLWDTAWFRWAQYNASISQPMARNVSEALGVRAQVRLTMDEAKRYQSSVRMDALYEMESLLSGRRPGEGLQSPRWPEEHLGRINRVKAERGRAHYERLCAGCHQGWPEQAPLGRPEVRLTTADLRQIGTDPKAAVNFATRTVHLPWEPNGPITAAEGLRRVTNGVMNRWYAENGRNGNGGKEPVGPEERWRMNGQSENEWQAPLAYRARPLNGVWATAPYLHNGSVPNLDEPLSPVERRSEKFRVGSRKFDPDRVGFDTAEGGFPFDTSLPGNSNRGHEFRDGPRGDGVIGPALSQEERRDLIEYLKTL